MFALIAKDKSFKLSSSRTVSTLHYNITIHKVPVLKSVKPPRLERLSVPASG